MKQVKNVNDTQVKVTDDRVVVAVRSHREFTKSDRKMLQKRHATMRMAVTSKCPQTKAVHETS
ncbi:hypothetical protein KQR57_14750 [Bacillus inaquosorum]|nr:hypothetical protein [Bacillus inaquosorum]